MLPTYRMDLTFLQSLSFFLDILKDTFLNFPMRTSQMIKSGRFVGRSRSEGAISFLEPSKNYEREKALYQEPK
jgi:hypothetical protein